MANVEQFFLENGHVAMVLAVPLLEEGDEENGAPAHDGFQLIGENAKTNLYAARFEAGFPEHFFDFRAIVRCPFKYQHEKGFDFHFVAKHADVVNILKDFRARKVPVKIKKVANWDPKKDFNNSNLTTRQMRIFQYALQNGYFKIPRRISTKKIARYFSISPVATLEHLRKAQHRLLRDFFVRQEKIEPLKGA